MKSDFPVLVGLGRLQEPAHVGPASWNRTWSPTMVWGQAALAKRSSQGFFNGTDVVSIAAPPRYPVEIACNQVDIFTKHHGTDGNGNGFSWRSQGYDQAD